MNIMDYLLKQQLMNQQAQPGMPAMPTNDPAMLQAMQPHPVPQAPYSPLAQGAQAAINAAGESPGRGGLMDTLRRSVGRHLSYAGAAKLRSHSHPRLREMGNMMQTVDEQEEIDRIRQFQLAQFIERQQRDMELADHRRAELAEKRRYHDMRLAESRAKRSGKGGHGEDYRAIEDQIMQEHGDSVQSLEGLKDNRSAYMYAMKDVESKIKIGSAAGENISILNRLKEIVNHNPRIYNSLGALMVNANKEEPTAWHQIAANATSNKKDRADIEEAGKLIANLYASNLHTLPGGTRMNQYLEKEFKKGIPDLSMVPESSTRIMDHLIQQNEELYEEGEKTSDYYQKGFRYKPKIRSLKKLKISSGSGKRDLSQLSTEDLRAKIAEMEAAKGK